MKTLLLLIILFYGLQFASCKTSEQAFAIPEYPRNAELHHGNYGGSMYSASTASTQAKIKMYYTYCDTAGTTPVRNVAPTLLPLAPTVALIQ